ncbi:MAG: PQQ-like beta-propeller repeat protein, partial [Planctomycetales bacterium]
MLHCRRAIDGELVWKIDTVKEVGVAQNFFGVGSTPVVEGDLLLVHIGGSPAGSDQIPFAQVQGNGSGVVAFDKFTGKVKYQFSKELASYSSPVLATIKGRRWCFVLARGGLLGFDPATGKEDFRFPWRASILESVNAANPVVVGDEVLISETYGPGSALLQVAPGSHKVIWDDKDAGRDKALQCHWNTPIYHDGYVYGCSGRHSGPADLRCVEWKTGKVQWTQKGLGRTSLMMIDGHFICLGEYGNLHLLKVNPKKYDEVSVVLLRDENAKQPAGEPPAPLLKYPCWAAPIVSHGLMYVQGKGLLVCMELIPPSEK